MRPTTVLVGSIALYALAWGSAAEAQAPANVPREVSQHADQWLKQMSAYLGSASEFTFHADILFDHVLP